MKRLFAKIMAMLLAVSALVGVLSVNSFANSGYSDSNGGSDYYNVISEREWDLAPGIKEYEQVLNNDDGTRRQVLHTAAVDLNNPYTKVIAGYKGMWPQEGNYGVQSTSIQALEAEKLGVGNVVVATNTTLSWYTEAYYKENPHLIGEPLGYTILDGEYYTNSRGHGIGAATVIVINYDEHPLTGEPRPEDMPKVWIRKSTDPLTGWEEQAIPVSFTFLVKPDANGVPVNQYANATENNKHGSGDIASRTFVGVRADGTLLITVSDGEQAPYSTGFSSYEMAEYMIKMGCIIAANCDGGGSTTFCSQRPGEDLKVNCSLSDGGERPTTSTILVITTAPADGTFARAQISSDYDYYTPGSSVTFSALGTDAVGTKVELPADVQWQIKEDGMGTVANGVFTSNGTEGTVTVQMVYDGNVVGEKSITIATPDTLFFDQPVVTIPFGKTARIPVKATADINGVDQEIGLSENDVTFTTTNAALGQFSGLSFIATEEAAAPADITSVVTATLNMGNNPTATVNLNLGKASEVLWDFEGGQADIDIWNVINNRKNAAHWDYEMKLSLADRTNGQVHDGNYSMRLETNGLSSKDSHAEQYAWIRLGVDGDAVVLKNARRVGFWLYVPEDNVQCMVQGHYMTDSNGDGTFDSESIVNLMEQEDVYYKFDESGWHYLSMDISAFEEVALKAAQKYDKDPSDGMTGETGEFFLALIFHKVTNNLLWSENGSINGNYTYYLDNFTVDYSEAVDDREFPIFDKVYLDGTTALIKRDVVTTTSNVLNLSVAVADKTTLADAMGVEQPLYNVSGLNASTAKAYVDGVEVDTAFDNGVISASGIKVADGYHRVKFEICDNAGNKSSIVRVVKVESGSSTSTLKLVPADATLDRIPFGSIYWMNLEATNIETIQSVSTVIDLNNVNHWQLDHMELAEGFTADYTIAEETNTATITITRTGDNYDTGVAVLAKLPVRIVYFDTDIKTPGYTAETYWTSFPFSPQDMKMDVDMGLITFTDGTTGSFSNEEFHVDTEMFTDRPHMAQVDYEYLNSHGTTHVHTPAAIADKAATCAENGYTGRTFCEGCNSVVEWGTTIPATGHTFKVALDKIVCDCGRMSNVSGLQTFDGKNYYALNGTLLSGWYTVDDAWYYFDEVTFAGADGTQYADNGVEFNFENGRVLSGTWTRNSNGVRYWYGPGYYRDSSAEKKSCRPYEIDGNTYLFNRQGYMQTGIVFYCHTFSGTSADIYYYDCGTDGVASLLTGPYNGYFYKDGKKLPAYQLVEFEGNFYFINDGHKLAKDTTIYLSERFVSGHTFADGTPLKVGSYEFDADGKMIIKQGPVGDYFYRNGVMQKSYQLVEFEGNYYFIDKYNKLAKNTTVYLKENFTSQYGLAVGRYEFDADGKMIIKQGPIGDYFYRDGVMLKSYQLVEFEGNYYFIDKYNKLAKNTTVYLKENFTAQYGLAVGRYEFDADGKMIIKQGPIGDYFYRDGVMLKSYQLVEFEGNYYFIDKYNKLAKNTTVYLKENFTAQYGLAVGRYEFDADGKMIIKHGVIGDYFYLNGVQQKAYQLVNFEGNYYFIDKYNKIAKSTTVYLTEKFTSQYGLAVGRYEFDADGKMIVKHGVVGDYLYIMGTLQKAYQLVEFEGNFYFVNNGNKIAKNTSVYLSERFVMDKTYADGTMLEVGRYYFDADGKMILN